MFLKRISFFLFIYSISINSQTLNDVLEFSIKNPIGTARFESMGGAFGALGGDLSSININPAGSAVFNDNEYGGDKVLKGTTFTKYKQFVENCFKVLPRQALHAKSLGFIHPTSNKFMEFESELPDDFKLCLDKWTNYSKHQM